MNFIRNFFSPTPFKLGIVLTLLFSWLSISFYLDREQNQNNRQSKLYFLHQMHLKSIDYRLNARGERPGSPDIAIIAVDEKALEKLGRWPWPRGLIANIIDQTVLDGAKVIAFDSIFSEPDDNQAVLSLKKLKETPFKDTEIYKHIDEELKYANTDRVLAESIQRNAEHLVMGSYFDVAPFYFRPFNQRCAEQIYQKLPPYSVIENQESPILALDDHATELAPGLIQYWETKFQEIAIRIQNETPNKNAIDLRNQIQDKQFEFCAKTSIAAVDPYYGDLEKAWPDIRATKDEWKDLSFSDFINLTETQFLKNQVELTGKLWVNLEILNQGTKHLGYFNAFLDNDGTIRRSALISRYADQYIPSLALKSVMVAKGYGALVKVGVSPIDPNVKRASELSLTDLETGDTKAQIPIDGEGSISINFAGPRYMFPHISASEILNKKETAVIHLRHNGEVKDYTIQKKQWFKNKIFIFGATATGIYDLRVTSFDENYPGVETHANVIDNILRNDFLTNLPDESMWMFGFLIVLGFIFSYTVSRLGAVYGLALAICLLAGLVFADEEFLFSKGHVISIILPLAMITGIYISLTFFKYFTEERLKRELKGTFQKYVSPAIVDELLKDAKNIELGGKKIHMSVMFSDVRGFTTISEKLDPRALGDFLNSYLTPMTDLVFKNKGTLDKYMGDAIMAFWGAPLHFEDHAKLACHCALQMMVKLDELQKGYKDLGLPPIDIGIGINTGDMSVGNMGSETVRSYTVMGDSVNLGSRLEGINKEYGTHIIISEFTNEEVKDTFLTREIDRVRVKGKLKPVRIYELLGIKAQFKDEKKSKAVEHFLKGFEFYIEKDFAKALSEFKKALELKPEDGPSELYIERCEAYIAEPPPQDWDGVFNMKTK